MIERKEPDPVFEMRTCFARTADKLVKWGAIESAIRTKVRKDQIVDVELMLTIPAHFLCSELIVWLERAIVDVPEGPWCFSVGSDNTSYSPVCLVADQFQTWYGYDLGRVFDVATGFARLLEDQGYCQAEHLWLRSCLEDGERHPDALKHWMPPIIIEEEDPEDL
jgi:hypothetical protein